MGHGAADFTVAWVNRSECWHDGCPYQLGICPSCLCLGCITVTSAEGSGAEATRYLILQGPESMHGPEKLSHLEAVVDHTLLWK